MWVMAEVWPIGGVCACVLLAVGGGCDSLGAGFLMIACVWSMIVFFHACGGLQLIGCVFFLYDMEGIYSEA